MQVKAITKQDNSVIRSWIIWFIAGIFYLYEFIHRVIISVMLPELMQSFHVSVAALGSLSACYFYAYALAQIPVGMILDRYSVRLVLTTACLMLTAASLLFAITSNFVIAETCRVIIGLGSAFAFVGCLKLGSSWFQGKQFGFIIGLTNLLGITGAILGGKPAAHAIDFFGWRYVMFVSAILGIIIAIGLWSVVRDKEQYNRNANITKILQHLLLVLKCKQIWLIALFGAFMVAPIGAYSELWGVSFLINHYHLDRPLAAQITTITFIGIACGGPTIGWVSDQIQRNKLPMLYGAAIAGICMALILSGIKFTNLTMTLWFLGILHFTFGFFTSSMLLSFSLATSTCDADSRATTIAFVNTIIMIMVALLQSLSGFLLDISKADFTLSFMPIILCYLFAFICYNCIQEGPERFA